MSIFTKIRKLKPLKIIGKAIQAVPVVVAFVADPLLGVLAVAGAGGGAGAKKIGKLAESVGLGRPHKVLSPVASGGVPVALHGLLAAFGIDTGAAGQITSLLSQFGIEGINPWVALGLALWLSHQFGNNVEKSGNK